MRVLVSVLAAMVFGATVTSSVPTADASVQAPTAAVQKPGATLKPAEASLVGTIERFEESPRRLVITTKDGHVSFVVAADAVVRLGSRTLTVAALDAHRGRRAKVRFTLADGRRTAHWVVISSDPPTRVVSAD